MNIDSIHNGVVIDHITAGMGMELYKLLELDKLACQVALITNATSSIFSISAMRMYLPYRACRK